MGVLRISCSGVQTQQVAFPCRVYVTGGLAGDTVDIRLWQTAGVAPMYQGIAQVQLDAGGDGVAQFDVTLAGPCTARLVADDDRSSMPLNADDVHIRVNP